MTATDELRRLLDERGVEYGIDDESAVVTTLWTTQNGGWAYDCHYSEFPREKPGTVGAIPELMIFGYSPEQAVTATLGRGTCHDQAAPSAKRFCCSMCCTTDARKKPLFCHGCGRKVVEQ